MLMFRQSLSKTRYTSSWASDRVILLFFVIVTIKMLNLYFNPAHQASSNKVHYNGPLDSGNWQELHGLVQLDQFKRPWSGGDASGICCMAIRHCWFWLSVAQNSQSLDCPVMWMKGSLSCYWPPKEQNTNVLYSLVERCFRSNIFHIEHLALVHSFRPTL